MEIETVEYDGLLDELTAISREHRGFVLAGAASFASWVYGGLVAVAASISWINPWLRKFVDDPRWDFVLGPPILLTTLFASVLLMGSQRGKPWRRRCLLLFSTTVLFLIYWCTDHHELVGRAEPIHRGANDPALVLLLRAFVLVRVIAIAQLSEPLVVAVMPNAWFTRWLAVWSALAGFVFWGILSLAHLDWDGTTLRWRNIENLQWHVVLVASLAARALSNGMALVSCVLACRVLRTRIRELKRAEHDSFGPLH